MLKASDNKYYGDLLLTNNVLEESPVVVRDGSESWSTHAEYEEIDSCVQALEKGVELNDGVWVGNAARFAFVQTDGVVDVKHGARNVHPVTLRLKCAASGTAGCGRDFAVCEKVDDRTFPSSCFSKEDHVEDR